MRALGWMMWLALAMALVAFLVFGVRAAEEPEVIAELRAKGAEIVALGRQGGLDGYFVRLPDGTVYTLYVTDGGYAVSGLLYAPDGALVTSAQLAMSRQLEGSGFRDPETVALEERFMASLRGHGFTLGSKGPAVLVFADPECRWSRLAVAELAQQAVAGALRLRVLPVALMGERSALRSMVVLSAEDPVLEWFEPGVGVVAGPEGRDRVLENNERFAAWGETAVPLTVFRNAEGEIVAGVGDIVDMRRFVAGLYREPDVPRIGR